MIMNFDFVKKEEKLSIRESKYWSKVFNANLMSGTEIEFEASSNNDEIRRVLTTGSKIGNFSGLGIESVDSDGSLRSGAEIRTSGKRLYGFVEQFAMYKSIIDKVYRFKPVVNSRAGWHNHVVLENYSGIKAQEMLIPGIIMKNVLSICKIFYPALAWVTSTMPGETYTRRNNFCHDDVLMNTDVSEGRISSIINKFTGSHNSRYNAINFNSGTSEDNFINVFHLEFRFPDCSLFPAQMATINFMFKAIIMKAIEISKYGVLSTTEENYRKIKKLYIYKNTGFEYFNDIVAEHGNMIKDFLLDGYERESCVLNDAPLNAIKSMANEFYNFIAPTMYSLDKTSAYMLKVLCDKPVTVMFKELQTNKVQVVNERFEEILDTIVVKTDNSILDVLEVIEKGLIRSVSSVDDWFNKASNLVTCKAPMNEIIDVISKQVPLEFNNEFGYYVKGE